MAPGFWQDAVALLIVGVTLALLLRRSWQRWRTRGAGNCGGCSGCATNEAVCTASAPHPSAIVPSADAADPVVVPLQVPSDWPELEV